MKQLAVFVRRVKLPIVYERVSLAVNTASIWLVRLPLGWGLAHFVFRDAYGVFMAMFISMVIQTSAMVWVFFRKDWARFALGAHAYHNHKEKA